MANQEFQQSAARADSWVEAKGYSNGAKIAVNEVYRELSQIESRKGTPEQKAQQEAEYLKVILDQNKTLKAHGFPEIEISEEDQHLTIKATGASGDTSFMTDRTPFSYGKENPAPNTEVKQLTSDNVLFHHLHAESTGKPAEQIPSYPAPQYVGNDGRPMGTELPSTNGGDKIHTGTIVDNASPELRARANLRHLSNGAIDISTDNFPPGPVYEGSTDRNVHFQASPGDPRLSGQSTVHFEIKLPYGVQAGDNVEGMVRDNTTGKNDDHIKGRVVRLQNGQLAFQGDEDVIIRYENVLHRAQSYNGSPADPPQLLVPLNLR